MEVIADMDKMGIYDRYVWYESSLPFGMEVIADAELATLILIFGALSSLPFGMEVIADKKPSMHTLRTGMVFIAFRHGGHC